MNKLILLRHGQSQWNLENRFTGWQDSPLTEKGIKEAKTAGLLMKKHKINIDLIFSYKKSELLVNDIKFSLNNLNFLSEKVSIKNAGNKFLIKGKGPEHVFDIDDQGGVGNSGSGARAR